MTYACRLLQEPHHARDARQRHELGYILRRAQRLGGSCLDSGDTLLGRGTYLINSPPWHILTLGVLSGSTKLCHRRRDSESLAQHARVSVPRRYLH